MAVAYICKLEQVNFESCFLSIFCLGKSYFSDVKILHSTSRLGVLKTHPPPLPDLQEPKHSAQLISLWPVIFPSTPSNGHNENIKNDVLWKAPTNPKLRKPRVGRRHAHRPLQSTCPHPPQLAPWYLPEGESAGDRRSKAAACGRAFPPRGARGRDGGRATRAPTSCAQAWLAKARGAASLRTSPRRARGTAPAPWAAASVSTRAPGAPAEAPAPSTGYEEEGPGSAGARTRTWCGAARRVPSMTPAPQATATPASSASSLSASSPQQPHRSLVAAAIFSRKKHAGREAGLFW